MVFARGVVSEFLRSERAAVTVDWVILAALVIGIAAPLASNYYGLLTGAAEAISSYIVEQSSVLPD